MRMKILVVDSNLLSTRTIAMMYEAYGCDVRIASDVKTSVDGVIQFPFNAVVMGPSFFRECGAQLHAAIKGIRPELCIAATGGPQALAPEELCSADVHLRPTHFFSDLCRYLASRAR